MKNFFAEVKIALRDGILDAQGKAIENSLQSLDFNQISNVRVGKIITFVINAENIDEARKNVDNAAKKLLANTIVEDFTVTINEK